MLFDHNETDDEISFFKLPEPCLKESKFYSAEEGFLKGNMLRTEYNPLEGYQYQILEPQTEKDCLLFQVMAYCFAVNDLNLYLDLHPDDKEAFLLFKKYLSKRHSCEEAYALKYGPLSLEDNTTSYEWLKGPWPWEDSNV